MSISTDPYIWVAAILTLCIFSFLYRDNPFFCFAEHLVLGLSTGYMFCILWQHVFIPELITPLVEHGTDSQAHLWFAVVLCFFWACKFIDRAKDLFRLALAFWVAIDLGLTIPMFMEAKVLSQIAGTVNVSLSGGWVVVLGNIILVVGTVSALTYFFFSKAHEGIVGATAKLGTWVLMIGFGATFSYVVLSRIYLLIGRLLFLMRDWLGIIA
ncbi:MAG: hypothetical protein GY847_02305 [Proteobacteria bacterium]|nr:hypothetical protein [Pseudomonadota bacterium]